MVLKYIKESWQRKRLEINKLSDEEKVVYSKNWKNYYLSLDQDLKNKLDNCFYYHFFRNFVYDNVCLEYLPYYKYDSLRIADIEKEFFKQYWNWRKLTQEEREILDKIVSYVYDVSVTDIYKYYCEHKLKVEIDF